MKEFQFSVNEWCMEAFGEALTKDPLKRNRHFLEESLELVQTHGYTAAQAHALVDYVFSRPVGEANQELGGVMVTMAALCNAHGLCIETAARNELNRVWEKIDQIRAKQASKVEYLPAAYTLPNVFESLHNAIAFDVRDWAEDKRSAWIYGVLLGWDEESMQELTERFGWDAETCSRLAELHRIVESITCQTK